MNDQLFGVADILFYAVALVTIASAALAVFSSNIVRAMFSLLGTFLGVAVFYGMLNADFVAAIQLMVYVGGILVLLLFAVMLTSQIETVELSNLSGGWLAGGVVGAVLFFLLASAAWLVPWPVAPEADPGSTVAAIGSRLTGDLALLFEVAGLVMLAVVVGAVTIARRERQTGDPR